MKPLLSFLVLASFFIASCKSPKAFVYKDIRNFKIDKVGLSKSTVSMNFIFFNPNNYGVNLKRVDCDLYLNSNYMGKVILDTLMKIPKASEFSLPANFDVDMKNLFKNSLSLIFNNDVLIGAKGTTRVGRGGFYVNIPFNYEGRQSLNLLK